MKSVFLFYTICSTLVFTIVIAYPHETDYKESKIDLIRRREATNAIQKAPVVPTNTAASSSAQYSSPISAIKQASGQATKYYQSKSYSQPVYQSAAPRIYNPPPYAPYASQPPSLTAHQSAERNAHILSSVYNYNPQDFSFEYGFELDNGLSTQVRGYQKEGTQATEGRKAQVIEGSYAAFTPEGTPSKITYTADENGYNPSGEGIPTIPPIIAKAVAYLKSLPTLPPTAEYKGKHYYR